MSIFCGQASGEQLMREADLALYRSKQECRGALTLFQRRYALTEHDEPLSKIVRCP